MGHEDGQNFPLEATRQERRGHSLRPWHGTTHNAAEQTWQLLEDTCKDKCKEAKEARQDCARMNDDLQGTETLLEADVLAVCQRS